MTMTTGWLLLLLLLSVVSSPSVDGQPTSGNETRDEDVDVESTTPGTHDDDFDMQTTTAATRDDVHHSTKQQRDVEAILENQQQLSEQQKLLLETQHRQFQTLLRNQQKIFDILQQHQTILDRLGKSSAVLHIILASPLSATAAIVGRCKRFIDFRFDHQILAGTSTVQ